MTHYDIWRLGAFLLPLFVLLACEQISPKRHKQPANDLLLRWRRNFSLAFINTLALHFVLPFSAVVAALYAENHNIGLLHSMPLAFSVPLALVLLDCAIYWQHRLFHAIPVLWRLHKIHHIDHELDATSGVRFHPLEMLLSMGIKCGLILLLGAPLLAVMIFEIMLNVASLFSHANIGLPKRFDAYMRLFWVTPDMHRVHHSIYNYETNSNYGFHLSLWDYLFGSYRAQPKDGHANMTIGLSEYQCTQNTNLRSLLCAVPLHSTQPTQNEEVYNEQT